MAEIRICEICGRTYIPKSPNAKYCGKECRDKSVLIKRRKDAIVESGLIKKKCPVCGVLFFSDGAREYCSDGCYMVAKKKADAANAKKKSKKGKKKTADMSAFVLETVEAKKTYGKLQELETIQMLREQCFWGKR